MHWVSSPLGGVLTIIDVLGELSTRGGGWYLLSLTQWMSCPPGVVLTIIDALGELSTRGGTCYH